LASSDDFKIARECWDASESASSEQRKQMLEDLKFSNPADPDQWDPTIRLAREMDAGGARPVYSFDQSNQYIAQVVNDQRMNKPQIQTIPADSGAHKKVADALDGMIRQIEYASSASIAYDTAVEHAARVGLGWFRVVPEVVDGEYNLQEIRIRPIHDPLSVRWDPDFVMPDGSDQQYGFVETRMPKAEYMRKYKRRTVSNWKADGNWYDSDSARICEYMRLDETKVPSLVCEGPAGSGSRQTFTEDDYWQVAKTTGVKPKVLFSFTATQKKVLWSKMDGDDWLEDETEFPASSIPLFPVFGYVLWIEGKRHFCGMVRRMMPGQRAYNLERNTELEWMAKQPRAPYLVAWESVANHQIEWGDANEGNAAYLPWDHLDSRGNPLPPPARLAPPQPGSAFTALGQKGLADLQASIGMYRANLGAPSNETSGIAIKRREQQGDTANFHYGDNQARTMTQAGRVIVEMITRLYGDDQYGPREARTLGLDGDSDVVIVNSKLEKPVKPGAGKEPIQINLNTGKYDVRCKVGPAYASLREEMADQLTRIVSQSPQLMTVLGPMWARMQDWPEAEKVSQLLLALAPPPVQAIEANQDADVPPQLIAQLQQMQQQLQQGEQRSKALADALLEAEKQHDAAEAKLADKNGDLAIKKYQATTDRLKLIWPSLPPQEAFAVAEETFSEAGIDMGALTDDMVAHPTAGLQPDPGLPPITPPDDGAGQQQEPASAGSSFPGP
jgi:hypothetical protein